MYIDKAKIFIKAGNGGDGSASMHREKFVPNGGPDGGDGGNGGSVYFAADPNMRTLLDFHYRRKYAAGDGGNGGKKQMRGKNGDDLIIKVPPGTVVYDAASMRAAADIREETPRLLLRGGAGGRGNVHFATPTRQAPKFATPGIKKEGRYVILELKSIADVGLIGFPNVGKSTLLAAMTAANPKIANYHFTTLEPNLGVVTGYGQPFVMADIPGLIEGAAEGVGLGHDFLRHVERTRMLIHVVDGAGSEGRDPFADYLAIREELYRYSPTLAQKPEIVAANKSDMEGFSESFEKFKEKLTDEGIEVFEISAAARYGLPPLFTRVAEVLAETPVPGPVEESGVAQEWELSADPTYEVTKREGKYLVTGSAVELIFSRINPDDEASMRHFQKLLLDFGIVAALREAGAQDGDTVMLNDLEFEFYD